MKGRDATWYIFFLFTLFLFFPYFCIFFYSLLLFLLLFSLCLSLFIPFWLLLLLSTSHFFSIDLPKVELAYNQLDLFYCHWWLHFILVFCCKKGQLDLSSLVTLSSPSFKCWSCLFHLYWRLSSTIDNSIAFSLTIENFMI